MKLIITSTVLCVLSLLSRPLEAADPPKPKLDVHGDPIPAGADICLGTTRFRHGGSWLQVAFAANGKTLVTANFPHDGDKFSFCDVRTGKLLAELSPGEEKIKAFTVSADGKTAAVLTAYYRNRTGFLVMRLVDLVKREWVSRTEWQPPEEQQIYVDWGTTFTPDGLTLIMTARGGGVLVWDVASREVILDYKMSLPEKMYLQNPPEISPDGETLINLCAGRGITSWSWTAGKQPVVTTFGQENIAEIALSPDGKTLAFGINDRQGTDDGPDVKLWDIGSERVIQGFRCPGKESAVSQIEFSPDGKLLAVADGKSQSILVWETDTGDLIHQFEVNSDRADSLAFSPDGSLLATAGGDIGAIRVWDVRTGTRIAPELEGHENYVTVVAFPAKSTGQVFSVSDHGDVLQWDLATSRVVHAMRHSDFVRSLAVSPDGRLIVSSGLSDNKAVRLWETETGKELFRFPSHGSSGGHRPVAFLKGGQQIASFGEDMNLRLWDTDSGEKVAQYPLRPSGIDFSRFRRKDGEGDVEGNYDVVVTCHGSVFSPDGSLFVFSVYEAKSAYVFETSTGKELRKLDLPFRACHRAVSPDNRRLAVCSPHSGSQDANKRIVVCDLETGEEIWSYEFTDKFVGWGAPGPISFSPDGRLLAAAVCFDLSINGAKGNDRIEVWNAKTYEHLLTINDVPDISDLQSLSISADNRYLAGGQMNSTILVWDLLGEGLPKHFVTRPETGENSVERN